MKHLIFFIVLALCGTAGFAQSNSGISVHITDESGDGAVNWPVKIYQGEHEVMTFFTDDVGDGLAKPLAPNTYKVLVMHNDVIQRVDSIIVTQSTITPVRIDFRLPFNCGQPKGRILVRVLDSAGSILTDYPVGILWNGKSVFFKRTDTGGVVTSFFLCPGIYEVGAGYQYSHPPRATGIRVNDGDVWVTLYFNRPKNWQKEQKAGIRAYRKWKKKEARKAAAAERKQNRR